MTERRLPFGIHYEVDHLWSAIVADLTKRGVDPFDAEDAASDVRDDVERSVARVIEQYAPDKNVEARA